MAVAVRLPERRSLPSTLSPEQVAAAIDCQARLRDRFLFALLACTGMRIGQALGLRHEDVVAWERRIQIRAREGAPRRCLSCESFLTDGSFRVVHDQQQAETRRLLEKARKNNNVRLIEVLERDEHGLSRIPEGLDAIEADHASSEELDLRALAAPDQPEGP